MMRWFCEVCREVVPNDELLEADNPFGGDTLVGCPHCGEANTFTLACDYGECRNLASGGHPTPDGYKNRCWDHSPANKKFKEDG